MKKIVIEVIPHKEQRYNSSGDWFYDDKNVLQIRVSQMGDWKKEMLVAIHEFSEVILCEAKGITQEEVDDFDFDYEDQRAKGNERCQGEPGDAPKSPYGHQHCFATSIERMMCAALGISWDSYEKTVNEVGL